MAAPTRTCPSCETPLPAEAGFCPSCGEATPTEISGETTQATKWTFCPHCGTTLDPGDTACLNCGAGTPGATTTPSGQQTLPFDDAEIEGLTTELREALAPNIQLLRRLGQGGMGTVFLARDPALKRLVVVKVLSPELAHDEHARKRFEREAEAAAAVSHPNVVSVYQVGELPQSETSYFVMQHVDGPTLAEAFPEGTAIRESQAQRLLGEIASALAAAHARGLVHRDIKPSNIMLDPEGNRAVVLDFGISAAITAERQRLNTKLTVQGTSIGTPQYMSPEQAAGQEVTDRSDVYSLGLVAFELVTGRPPFEESNAMAVIAAHINKDPPNVLTLRSDLSPSFAQLIDRCLAKEATNRPAADDVVRALDAPGNALIEWLPPGLEQLSQSALALHKALGRTVLAILLVLGVLVSQPNVDTPRWQVGETSLIWAFVSDLMRFGGDAEPGIPTIVVGTQAGDSVTTPLWLFLLGLVALAAVAATAILVRQALRLGLDVWWARRLGYPLSVIGHVFLDRGSDTSGLMNGSGTFALLNKPSRERLLRLRRIRRGAAFVGLVLGVLGPVFWVTGWMRIWNDETVLILTGSEFLGMFAPAMLAVVAAAVCGVPEWRELRRESPARFARVITPGPDVRADVVNAWVKTAGHPAARRTRFTPLSIVPPLAAVLIGLAASVTIIVVLVTVISGSIGVRLARQTATTLLLRMETDTLRPGWQEVDSLLAFSSRLPGVTPTASLDTARSLFVGFARRNGLLSDLWESDGTDGVRWELPARSVLSVWRSSVRAGQIWGYLPGSIPDSVVDVLASDTLHPALRYWRTTARTEDLPTWWYLKSGLPGVGLFFQSDLPFIAGSAQGLAERNRSAAVLAMSIGDDAAALVRIRENIAMLRHVVHSALLDFEGWFTFAELRADAAALREIGRITRNQRVVGEAERLDSALVKLAPYTRTPAFTLAAMTADPENRFILGMMADSTLPPHFRRQLLMETILGACLNPRELLFGADPLRDGLLIRAEQAMSDLPRINELIDFHRRALADWSAVNFAGPWGEKPPRWLGLGTIMYRLSACLVIQ